MWDFIGDANTNVETALNVEEVRSMPLINTCNGVRTAGITPLFDFLTLVTLSSQLLHILYGQKSVQSRRPAYLSLLYFIATRLAFNERKNGLCF